MLKWTRLIIYIHVEAYHIGHTGVQDYFSVHQLKNLKPSVYKELIFRMLKEELEKEISS